jgi:hypothetical protein
VYVWRQGQGRQTTNHYSIILYKWLAFSLNISLTKCFVTTVNAGTAPCNSSRQLHFKVLPDALLTMIVLPTVVACNI